MRQALNKTTAKYHVRKKLNLSPSESVPSITPTKKGLKTAKRVSEYNMTDIYFRKLFYALSKPTRVIYEGIFHLVLKVTPLPYSMINH